ncbi:MAG: hypothetical protein DME59_16620, partial [Verrucomicrobia bacterium]
MDGSWSVARHRYPEARRCFYSPRAGSGRSRARARRGGADFSGCRSAQIDPGASHRHPFVALGIARSGLVRCFAKGELCRTRQIDVRLFKCTA